MACLQTRMDVGFFRFFHFCRFFLFFYLFIKYRGQKNPKPNGDTQSGKAAPAKQPVRRKDNELGRACEQHVTEYRLPLELPRQSLRPVRSAC